MVIELVSVTNKTSVYSNNSCQVTWPVIYSTMRTSIWKLCCSDFCQTAVVTKYLILLANCTLEKC